MDKYTLLELLATTAVAATFGIMLFIDAQRRAALADVHKSQKLLHLQFACMPIGCVITAPGFTITSWNPAAERIFGWSEDEIVGQSAAVLLPPDERDRIAERWSRLTAGDVRAQGINDNVTRDGRRITCRWSNTPLMDDAGVFLGVLSMIEDITEEQRVQAALRLSERHHRELLDAVPIAIFNLDNDGRYRAVNRTVCEFYGRTEEEIIGRTARELGVPDEIATRWEAFEASTRAAGTTQIYDEALPIHGRVRHAHVIKAPSRDESGAIVGISGIAMDLTDLKDAVATAQHLFTAVEQLDEVIFTTDRNGTITYVNAAFERVYGYTREEAIGQSPRLLKSGDTTREQYSQMWAQLLAGRSVRLECRNRRKNGVYVDVIASASPLFDESGGITGFIAVQQDVTEQKRAAEARRNLDERLSRVARMEALGTLAGGIAHDFNNILSIILTHATVIERRLADQDAVGHAATTIKQAVQRGASLSRQILTFARRTEMNTEPVELPKLILEVGSMVSETFPRTIQLTFDFDAEVPAITGDSGQLHQMLLNLCVNARDAMPSGGQLKIESRKVAGSVVRRIFSDAEAEEYVLLCVSDTGSGIDDVTRQRIFEPFFTTKEKGKGTGLGLAVVHGVVQGHGGFIDVDSQVGQGTVFRMYFPALAEEQVELEDEDELSTPVVRALRG